MAEFKRRIKELREEMGLSQEALGQRIGKSESTICAYELGTREPKKAEDFKILAEVFGVSIDYLLGKSDNKNWRLVTKNELREFLSEDEVEKEDWAIEVDDLNKLSDETKAEIREVLKKHGYLK